MKNLKPFIIICIVIILIWFVNMWWLMHSGLTSDERGTFGDMFGAINSLFSGIAMAGVIIAIIMQRQELELQREELMRTANANRKQAQIQKLSAEIQGLTSLLEITTDRLNHPVVKGAARGANSVYYSPQQLLQFQDKYMKKIETCVDQLARIK